MLGKAQMDLMAPMLLQMENQSIQVVKVHLHMRVSEWTALGKIEKIVAVRNDIAKLAQQARPSGTLVGVGEVKSADPIVGQTSKHLTENHFTSTHGDMLKHNIRMKEIENAG